MSKKIEFRAKKIALAVALASGMSAFAQDRAMADVLLLVIPIPGTLSPSLILTREQADTIIDTLRASIDATYEQLVQDGVLAGL